MTTSILPDRWNLGLRQRTTLIVAVATTVASIAMFTVLSWVADRQVDAGVQDELHLRAAEVAADVRAGDPLVDRLAQVLDEKGQVTAGSPVLSGVTLLEPAEIEAARAAPVTAERVVQELGGEVRIRAEQFDDSVVVVASPPHDLDVASERLGLLLAAFLLVLVAVITGATWFLVSATLRPVHVMASTAARIGDRVGPERIPHPGTRDEIAELAATLNGMLDRLSDALQRERAFIDDASHELRTPLTLLRGELELTLDEDDLDEMRGGASRALAAAERLSALAENLLVLARHGDSAGLTAERVELGAWLHQVADRLEPGSARIAVHTAGRGPDATVDVMALERGLTNLVLNATAAGASNISISVLPPNEPGGPLELRVEDDGPGLPESLLPHALDRFSRGDADRDGGAGLGLAIVDAIVRAHGGSVTLGNDSAIGGARVSLWIPLTGEGAQGRER